MKHIILASKSIYRKELLSRLMISFECIASRIDEDKYKAFITEPIELAKTLAFKKAQDLAEKYPNAIIIGSDQVVSLCEKFYDKPQNRENAIFQLSELSGKSHTLTTAVCLIEKNHIIEFQHQSHLKMKNLTTRQIEHYVDLEKPFDCAGSYKIESLGITLFDEVNTTDFTSIMGLPLIDLVKNLESLGIKTI